MRGQSDPDLTLLAMAGYEAIRKSMKGENDEKKEIHMEGKPAERGDRAGDLRDLILGTSPAIP